MLVILGLLLPLIGLYVWYKRADADITLLFYQKFGQRKLNEYDGKVIWITGASSGIGEAVAHKFAKLHAKLVLSGTRRSVLEAVARECETLGADEVLCLPFDIADHGCHAAKLQEIIENFGRVDALVNNAGRLQRALFSATHVDAEKLLFDVNVFGIVNVCRVLLNHWTETKQTSGQFFVTSSAAGKLGSPFSSSYAGSKHALHGYMETLRCELSCTGQPYSITMGCPGPVRSNLRMNALTESIDKPYNKNDDNSQRKLMETSRCADLIVTGLAHKLDELWIADQPILALFYICQYCPSVFRRYLLRFIMTAKQIEKFRKGE